MTMAISFLLIKDNNVKMIWKYAKTLQAEASNALRSVDFKMNTYLS